ncbi:hypothetical protein H7F10_06900 [Acidithiobacillus sp. HP-6]|uniref:hypothetical protein n=1 Tax=unclassified Acidithiobacillus TaxID=2614800 RepID=UPI00187A3D29|nr:MULTISPECIES: hypothetical protein [unclassified Acidithiobacillus]MBE7562682.1 hypothetical protein [Acidithiobacillus sp. HP-6]MBE7570522.1 hypothetical protein [Acidithiobacillus sp. HP-2]
MYQHNTVAGCFVLVNDEATSKALAAAKSVIGDPSWKKGYSEDNAKMIRAKLKDAKAPFQFKFSGNLIGVSTKETKDSSGNEYHKVRVHLADESGTVTILSLDVGTEFGESLVPKLGSAVMQLGLGSNISISAFPVEEERADGRKFINFKASVKDADGHEVKATKPHFKIANEKVMAAVEALKAAGIKDPKTLNAARNSAKEEYFWDLAQKVAAVAEVQCAAAAA